MTLDQNVERELEGARSWAEKGRAALMDNSLGLAEAYAQKARQNITAEVADIKKVGYEKAIPVELARARTWAEQGNGPLMELRLDIARDYAQRAGLDISEQVAGIRAGGK